ncbi:YqgE/AlgH family protein [Eisenibacter elegans]|uniref:YqgE/AlgH family protein n=1 Tax=Eisenibacter elegans TaxID=997 RepID=UPI0003FE4DBF|nr:YqgE/AlgH family protein [Eisenibacter elegans]
MDTRLKGHLLIAEPFLGDANFERSVVLLCEHNDDGAFGFVLNQPSEWSLPEVLPQVSDERFGIYIGGPVANNTLHFLHNYPEIKDCQEIIPNLYWGGDYEQLATLINLGQIDPERLRFFAGYSGWSAGQLEGELKQNAWIHTRLGAEFIFKTAAEGFWRAVLKQMGGKYKALANYPIDPRYN